MPQALGCAGAHRTACPLAGYAVLTLALTASVAGCGPLDTDGFLRRVQRSCVRTDAMHNPLVMTQQELRRVLGQPQQLATVDPHTQRWTYRCADGDVALYIVLEPGGTWRDDAARVFVNPKQRDVVPAQRDRTRGAARR
jgi:hypothetical protein